MSCLVAGHVDKGGHHGGNIGGINVVVEVEIARERAGETTRMMPSLRAVTCSTTIRWRALVT